jgi:hypothetical protein
VPGFHEAHGNKEGNQKRTHLEEKEKEQKKLIKTINKTVRLYFLET